MITRENIEEVILSLDAKTKKRILKAQYSKEYCVLELHVFNASSFATAIVTNDYNRYQNVSNSGGAILSTDYVINVLENN